MSASCYATWMGPFVDPEITRPERLPGVSFEKLIGGASQVVLTSTATQLWQADPTWWSFH